MQNVIQQLSQGVNQVVEQGKITQQQTKQEVKRIKKEEFNESLNLKNHVGLIDVKKAHIAGGFPASDVKKTAINRLEKEGLTQDTMGKSLNNSNAYAARSLTESTYADPKSHYQKKIKDNEVVHKPGVGSRALKLNEIDVNGFRPTLENGKTNTMIRVTAEKDKYTK